jgi:hypothetical protein
VLQLWQQLCGQQLHQLQRPPQLAASAAAVAVAAAAAAAAAASLAVLPLPLPLPLALAAWQQQWLARRPSCSPHPPLAALQLHCEALQQCGQPGTSGQGCPLASASPPPPPPPPAL